MKKKLAEIRQWLLKNRWKVLLSIVFTVAVLVIWINNVNTVNDLILENHRMEILSKDLISQNEDLRRRISQLKSPDRIIRIAQERCGLVLSEEAPLVVINPKLLIKKEE